MLPASGNGFVISLIVPQGNAADCSELVPSISDSIRRTGIVPGSVSTDDGYASAKGRDEVRDELLEKVLAYNCCRIVLMKKRRREKLDKVV